MTDEKLHPGETPCGRCGRTLPTLISQAAIAAAVRSAVDAHGPITREQIGSAAKRIYGQLKAERRAQHQCGDDSLDDNGPRLTPTQPDECHSSACPPPAPRCSERVGDAHVARRFRSLVRFRECLLALRSSSSKAVQ